MSAARFAITQADGATFVGVVQGCGGPVSRLDDMEKAIRLANDENEIGVYEPCAGHCAVFERFTATDNGPQTVVDLRGASVRLVSAAS